MIRKQKDGAPAPSTDASPRSEAPDSPTLAASEGVLHIGIDLGTSRSAVASANGTRECVGSVVGWPRDAVSSKVLGKSILYGDDALEHRLSLDMVWPLADGNLRYTETSGQDQARERTAGEELMRHLLSLARPRADQLIYAVIGAPAEASTKNKQAIIEISKAAGMDAVMVVSEPFSVAYGIDALDEAIVIDIGAGTIDLCRLHGTLPEIDDQITIFKAGNFVDEEIGRRIKQSHPEAQFTTNMVRKSKERFSGVVDSADRAIVTYPVDGCPTDIDITDEIHGAVSLLVPEIVDAIKKLVSSFDPEFQHRIRQRVYVSGGGSQIFGLQKALEEGMKRIGGGNVYLVEEPVFAGANGSLRLAQEMPAEYWSEIKTT